MRGSSTSEINLSRELELDNKLIVIAVGRCHILLYFNIA